MSELFRVIRPVRDTHAGKVHFNEVVRLVRRINTLSCEMYEVMSPEGIKFLVIPEIEVEEMKEE